LRAHIENTRDMGGFRRFFYCAAHRSSIQIELAMFRYRFNRFIEQSQT
jgi:hypothetical protein